jgi:crotonobetainyl-CoA:carnitine CoA-transferase CaiB-like acyl-CoA transferase
VTVEWPSADANLSRPLHGLKVLDLSRVLAGPFCTMLLADLGADVIKVEPPSGDETRRWGPPFLDGDATYFYVANRNKWDLVLDLTSAADKEKLASLIREADVLVQNYTLEVAQRLGVDYDTIHDMNERIIHVTISGFGDAEPNRRGYDVLAQALSGLMSITGDADGSPFKVGTAISDLSAGIFAALAVASAWSGRDAKSVGSRIDVSLFDSTVILLANQAMNYLLGGVEPQRMGNTHPSVSPYGSFQTQDGPMVIGVGTDDQFRVLCDSLGVSELAEDPRFLRNRDRVENNGELKSTLEGILERKSAAEWSEHFDARGIPNAVVRSVAEALMSPEAVSIGEVFQSDGTALRQVLNPIRINGDFLQPYMVPPKMNQHADQIFDPELAGQPILQLEND